MNQQLVKVGVRSRAAGDGDGDGDAEAGGSDDDEYAITSQRGGAQAAGGGAGTGPRTGKLARRYCENTVIQRCDFPPTEVFRTAECGFGLRVTGDVDEGTKLIEYLGEVVTAEECERRMSSYKIGDDFYFASLGGGLMLDARPCGSVARFANHSCEPNCELQKWNVMGERRICLVSLRPLKAGEEMTYNYQYHEDGLDCVKRQPCRCGSRNCAGTIGGKVQERAEDVWTQRTLSFM